MFAQPTLPRCSACTWTYSPRSARDAAVERAVSRRRGGSERRPRTRWPVSVATPHTSRAGVPSRTSMRYRRAPVVTRRAPAPPGIPRPAGCTVPDRRVDPRRKSGCSSASLLEVEARAAPQAVEAQLESPGRATPQSLAPAEPGQRSSCARQSGLPRARCARRVVAPRTKTAPTDVGSTTAAEPRAATDSRRAPVFVGRPIDLKRRGRCAQSCRALAEVPSRGAGRGLSACSRRRRRRGHRPLEPAQNARRNESKRPRSRRSLLPGLPQSLRRRLALGRELFGEPGVLVLLLANRARVSAARSEWL